MKMITIVIGWGFPLLSLSLVIEPLRVANRESLRPIFKWRILSVDGGSPPSSSSLVLQVDGALDEAPTDAVILLAAYSPEKMRSSALMAWLQRRAKSGCLMGCVDTGALLFAEAGLLSRRPAAAHHEVIVGFRELYGKAFFTDRLFDLDGDRCSSAGGVVTIDMTLAMIAHFAGTKLSNRVVQILNYRPRASSRANGAFGVDWSIPRLDRRLAKAVDVMLNNIENPVPINKIAEMIGLPEWKLRRLFLRHVTEPPQAYYLNLRLERARNLLRNSSEKIGQIALMCGFGTPASLSKAYRAKYGITPISDRKFSESVPKLMTRMMVDTLIGAG